jgi:hypothetical protein
MDGGRGSEADLAVPFLTFALLGKYLCSKREVSRPDPKAGPTASTRRRPRREAAHSAGGSKERGRDYDWGRESPHGMARNRPGKKPP